LLKPPGLPPRGDAFGTPSLRTRAGASATLPVGPPRQPARRAASAGLRWVAAAAVILAAVEAVVIVRLLGAGRAGSPPAAVAAVLIDSPQPGAEVIVDGRPAGATPLQLKVGTETRSIEIVGRRTAAHTDVRVLPQPRSAPDLRGRAAYGSRQGRFQVSSPIVMSVFEGDRLVGSSTDGAITTGAGRHELLFVNDALGYRARQVVDVLPGQTVHVEVSAADPWVNIRTLSWPDAWRCGWTTIRSAALDLRTYQSLWEGTTPCLPPVPPDRPQASIERLTDPGR